MIVSLVELGNYVRIALPPFNYETARQDKKDRDWRRWVGLVVCRFPVGPGRLVSWEMNNYEDRIVSMFSRFCGLTLLEISVNGDTTAWTIRLPAIINNGVKLDSC